MRVTMRQLRKLKAEDLAKGVEVTSHGSTIAYIKAAEQECVHNLTYPNGEPIAGSEPPRKWIADVASGEVRRARWDDQPGFWRQLNPKR